MKLVIQIPCYNEAQTLPLVFADLPKEIPGIDLIETVVVDDGSTDGTSQVAEKLGADCIVRNTKNLGLAFTFRKALDTSLSRGADIVVNIDGDNQYRGSDIAKLIAPILELRADIVVGDRRTDTIAHFSIVKKFLQRLGSRVVRSLSRTKVHDAASGFRAFSREAGIRITVLSNYTYTLESLLQAQSKGFAIENIEIETNPKTRDSHLMSSTRSYVTFSTATIIRVFTMYNPLRVFLYVGGIFMLMGLFLGSRFLYFYLMGAGAGKVQSLILAAVCMIVGVMVTLVGLIADIIQFNRRLLEEILVRTKRLEYQHKHDSVSK